MSPPTSLRRALSRPLVAACLLQGLAAVPAVAQGWSRSQRDLDPAVSYLSPQFAVAPNGEILVAGVHHSGPVDVLMERRAPGGERLDSSQLVIFGDFETADMVLHEDGLALLCGQEPTRDQAALLAVRASSLQERWIARLAEPDSAFEALATGEDGRLLAVGRVGEEEDVLAVCFDAEGSIHWQHRYGDIGSRETAQAVVATDDGGYLLGCSTTALGSDFQEPLLMRLDADGQVRWQQILSAEEPVVLLDLARAGSDRSLVCGAKIHGEEDIRSWIAMLDDEGNILWETELLLLSAAHAVSAAPDGGALVLSHIHFEERALLYTRLDEHGTVQQQAKLRVPASGARPAHAVELEPHVDGGWLLGSSFFTDGQNQWWTARIGDGGRIGRCCSDELSEPIAQGTVASRVIAALFPARPLSSTWTDLNASNQPLQQEERLHCSTSFGAWSALGGEVPGLHGAPCYAGVGTLEGGAPVNSILSRARPFASATLVLGFSRLDGGIFGGTLVPYPDILFNGLRTNVRGEIQLPGSWPVGFLPGTELFLQYLVVDPSAPFGVAMSNAVRAITP